MTLIKVKISDQILGRDYTYEGQVERLKYAGKYGNIISEHNSHGLCYTVKFPDGGIATYDPDELEIISVV